MTALDALAELQDLDTRIDQLRHRRENLGERSELADADRAARRLASRRADVEARHHDVEREQRRLEDEVALVEDKAEREDQKLYSGSVTAPKELTALQDEVASLRNRQRTLEDELLEVMERAEPLAAELDEIAEEERRLEAHTGRLQAALTVAEAEIDAETAELTDERDAHARTITEALRRDYESRRQRYGGVVVGRLRGRTCSACSLALSAVDVDRITHLSDDEPVDCPECGVLLVR